MWLIGGSLTNILPERIEISFVLIFILTCSCFVVKQSCKSMIIKVVTYNQFSQPLYDVRVRKEKITFSHPGLAWDETEDRYR